MHRFFRNIYFALVILAITYNACVASEDPPSTGTMKRNSSLVTVSLEDKDTQNNKQKMAVMQMAPECCCVHIILDCLLGYYMNKYKE